METHILSIPIFSANEIPTSANKDINSNRNIIYSKDFTAVTLCVGFIDTNVT